MVQSVKIPWAAWYGDEDFALEFPDSWDVKVFNMKNAIEVSVEEIRDALNNFPAPLEIISYDDRAAIHYGDIRTYLEKIGQPDFFLI